MVQSATVDNTVTCDSCGCRLAGDKAIWIALDGANWDSAFYSGRDKFIIRCPGCHFVFGDLPFCPRQPAGVQRQVEVQLPDGNIAILFRGGYTRQIVVVAPDGTSKHGAWMDTRRFILGPLPGAIIGELGY